MLFKRKKTGIKTLIETLKRSEISIKLDFREKVCSPDSSKFGGMPFLPKEFEWPYYAGDDYDGKVENRPLTFLCQINLNEVKKYDRENLLPTTGMLYFFYEIETMKWGFDPKDKGCAHVYYFDNCDGFVVTEYPDALKEEYRLKEISIDFSAKSSFPSWEELEFYTDNEIDCEEYIDELGYTDYDIDSERHKLLGYANIIQNEMLTECEAAERGIYCGDGNCNREELMVSAKDWVLLFQMGSIFEDGYDLMWGDMGNLYFYIKKNDLKNRNFKNIWLILQCG